MERFIEFGDDIFADGFPEKLINLFFVRFIPVHQCGETGNLVGQFQRIITFFGVKIRVTSAYRTGSFASCHQINDDPFRDPL